MNKIPSKVLSLVLGIFFICGASGKLQALPVSASFFPGTTGGEYALFGQYLHFDFVKSTDTPAQVGLNPRATTDMAVTAGYYGITKTFGVFLFVPWIHNEFRMDTPTPTPGTFELKASGLGDIAASLFSRIYQWEGKGWYATV